MPVERRDGIVSARATFETVAWRAFLTPPAERQVHSRFARPVAFTYRIRRSPTCECTPKNNENCVFAAKRPESSRKIASYFRFLHRKFVTAWINGIFHGINELKLP